MNMSVFVKFFSESPSLKCPRTGN